MKRVLFLAFVIVFSANLVFAQAGAINLFQTPGGVNCDLPAPPPGNLWVVYAVHVLTAGATASQWSAPLPACTVPGGLTIWLSDTPVFPVTLGNSQTGVAIGYGGCFGSPIHVLTIQMLTLGFIPNCCVWPVVGDPNSVSGLIEVVDCGGNLLTSPSNPSAVINPDPSCSCFAPIATENKTWGGVKALYMQQ